MLFAGRTAFSHHQRKAKKKKLAASDDISLDEIAAAAAKKAVQNRIDALLAEGKSLEGIMNMLG